MTPVMVRDVCYVVLYGRILGYVIEDAYNGYRRCL
jgi:hypothetical protein